MVNELIIAGTDALVPVQVAEAGEEAVTRFIEFFTANIRNPNTTTPGLSQIFSAGARGGDFTGSMRCTMPKIRVQGRTAASRCAMMITVRPRTIARMFS